MKPTEQEIEKEAQGHLKNTRGLKSKINRSREIIKYISFKAGYRKAISQMQPEWVACSERLPEDEHDLIMHPDLAEADLVPLRTKEVLVLTDMGSVINNSRLKMMIGEKEWRWFMGLIQKDGSTDIFDGETITHWTYLPQPPTK